MSLFTKTLYSKTSIIITKPTLTASVVSEDDLSIPIIKVPPLAVEIEVQISENSVFYGSIYSSTVGISEAPLVGGNIGVVIPLDIFTTNNFYYIRIRANDSELVKGDWSDTVVYQHDPSGTNLYYAVLSTVEDEGDPTFGFICSNTGGITPVYLENGIDPSNITIDNIIYTDEARTQVLTGYTYIRFVGDYPPQVGKIFSINNSGVIIAIADKVCP